MQICGVLDHRRIVFPCIDGDVLTAHARDPFEGVRKVVVWCKAIARRMYLGKIRHHDASLRNGAVGAFVDGRLS